MLRLTLKVNKQDPIADVSIRRISPNNPSVGDVCVYNVETIIDGKLAEYLGDVECEFGSANKLAIKVLNFMEDK